MSQPLVWALAFALLWVPGRLIHDFIRPRPCYDTAGALAGQIALGLAFWPILFLWTSVLRFRWTAGTARSFFIVLTVAVVANAVRHRGRQGRSGRPRGSFPRFLPLGVVVALAA